MRRHDAHSESWLHGPQHRKTTPAYVLGLAFSRRALRKQAVKAGAFAALIGLLFLIFWTITSSINLYSLKAFTAQSASAILSAFGVPHALEYGEEPALAVKNVTALITNLCAGDVEIALLAAILLATFDRPLRRRLWGCAFGLLLVLAVNPLRIATVLAVGYYADWQWADFSHDFLFRLTLIITIVLYYFLWYAKYDETREFFVAPFRRLFPTTRSRE